VYNLGRREDGDHHYGYSPERFGDCEDKFQRLSWRSDMNTVEFRIFASSTEASVIKGYLDSVVAITKFFKNINGSSRRLVGYASDYNSSLYNILTEDYTCA
jgi:hypothetical protein